MRQNIHVPLGSSLETPNLTKAIPVKVTAQTRPDGDVDTWPTSQLSGVGIRSHPVPSGQVVVTPCLAKTLPKRVTTHT